jgi:hypothetical protein
MENLKNPILLIFILLISCKQESQNPKPLFQLLSPEETGISFRNDLSYTEQLNPYTFRNFYDVAGVALGDINNDGLLEVFFAGNQTSNKLFPESILSKSVNLSVQTLATTLWINDGSGKFKEQALPSEIQQAPVYAIEKISTPSGKIKILMGGNQSRIKPELVSQMGSYGWSIASQPDGSWKAQLPEQSGLFIPGEIRDFQ